MEAAWVKNAHAKGFAEERMGEGLLDPWEST